MIDGASVSVIACELKINTNQLFSWRKRFVDEALAGGAVSSRLVAVTVVDTPPVNALLVEGHVDAATLTLLLARLMP